jgi:toxin ParE1/3/4
MQIKWTKLAQEDLESIQKYIYDNNPTAAKEVALHIINRVEILIPENNAIGKAGRILGTRELVITKYPYIVPYRLKNDEIQVLRVLHTSRKWDI